MIQAEEARKIIEKELSGLVYSNTPAELYDPIRYVLDIGGKRVRPVLCLMGCSLFSAEIQKALPAAVAIEVFHNFTLLHDDYMDNAPLRRNRPTVHIKWNSNIAILSGDAMLIKAYELISSSDRLILPEILKVFNRTALEVCEGQQFDMNFENSTQVSEAEYLKMIELKTAVLLAASLKIGALAGGADKHVAESLYEAGRLMGIAFQLQDDLLDTFGDAETFGKQIGGDIAANKKTWLFIKTFGLMHSEDQALLLSLYSGKSTEPAKKIEQVKELFRKYKVDDLAEEQIRLYSSKAIDILQSIPAREEDIRDLTRMIHSLMGRKV